MPILVDSSLEDLHKFTEPLVMNGVLATVDGFETPGDVEQGDTITESHRTLAVKTFLDGKSVQPLDPFNKDNRVVLERPLRAEEMKRTTASLDCDYRNHVWKQRQHQLNMEQQKVEVVRQGSSGKEYKSCGNSQEKIKEETRRTDTRRQEDPA